MKIRINQIILLITVLLMYSCGNGNQLKDGDTIFFPDTTAFKQSWKMEEKQMRDDLFAADTFYNQLGLDTFELTFRLCACPDWIDTAKLSLDCKECSDFYTDPAAVSMRFPDEFLVDGNTVQFYGVRIPGMNTPTGREFSTPWTVIRYYGYEVVRPYRIWGPTMMVIQNQDTVEKEIQLVFH